MPAPAGPDPRRVRRRIYKAISSGTFLICTGVVLLLNTLGSLGWGVWLELALLWPILLISAGIRLVFVETRLHLLCLAGPLMVAASTAYVAVGHEEGSGLFAAGEEEMEEMEARDLECPGRAGRDHAYLDIRFGAGDLRVGGPAAPASGAASRPARAAASAAGFRGKLRYRGLEPRTSCSRAGDLGLGWEWPGRSMRIVYPFGRPRASWEVELEADRPIALDMDMAAAYAEMDLTPFDLTSVTLDAAASSVELRLGAPRRRVPVRVDGAVVNLRLLVPQRTCFTLWRRRVLNVLDIEPSLRGAESDDRVVAEACQGIRPDAPRYEIRCELPLAHVRVEAAGRPL